MSVDAKRSASGLFIRELCEHCGAKGQLTTVETILKESVMTYWVVACPNCGAQGPRGGFGESGKARAVIGWNTRLFRKGGKDGNDPSG